jgi:hypothetical protein
MKKLLLGAAISAAFFSGISNAAITLDASGKPVITPANTYEIYLSGASAPRAFIEQLITNAAVPDVNQICKPATTIYKYKDNVSGGDQNAYLCELNTLNPALSGLAAGKTNLLIYKRSLGGSAMGVNPIIADAAISFMKIDNPAICSAPVVGGGLSTLTCTYVEGNLAFSQNQKADFGVSDVDPIQFSGVNTPSGFAGVTNADLNKITVKSAVAQTFGVVVTTKLREALQQAQFPATSGCNPTNAGHTPLVRESAGCQPTLDSAQLASIFTGSLVSWQQLKVGAAGNLYANATAAGIQPSLARIHICRRTNGSGTGAQFNAKFLNYPCAGAVATVPKPDTGALPEAIAQTQVHQMGSSGQVNECMSELDAGVNTVGTAFNNTYGFRWAIGIQGTENNANLSSGYRFIKVDGVAPTLQNVVNGKYKDWVELTYQFNKTHVFDPSELNIVNEIIKQSGNPIVIGVTNNPAAAHTWGQSGFLAVPQSFAAPASGVVSLTQPVNPLSHGTTTKAPNACRAPAIYNPGVAGGMQLN